jgi:hypothetical protein
MSLTRSNPPLRLRRWPLRARAAAWLVAIGMLVAAAPAAAQTSPAQAARDSIRTLGLQRELPQDPVEKSSWNIKIPPEVVWAILICGLALVLYAFRDMVPIWRLWPGHGWENPAADQPATLAQEPADVVVAADELERQGRFVEAMHMLLLLSLTEIRRYLGEQFADSLTSREILRGARLSVQGRASLREMVARVEWTYFGGHPATRDDYAACRQSFESLRGALRAGLPA